MEVALESLETVEWLDLGKSAREILLIWRGRPCNFPFDSAIRVVFQVKDLIEFRAGGFPNVITIMAKRQETELISKDSLVRRNS